MKKFIFLCYCLLLSHSVFFFFFFLRLPKSHFIPNYIITITYHTNQVPRDEEGEPLYEDFICGTCSAVCSFLILYPKSIWTAEKKQHTDTVSACKNKDVVVDTPLTCGSGKDNNGSNISPRNGHILADAKLECVSDGSSRRLEENPENDMGIDKCNNSASSQNACLHGVDLMVSPPGLEKKPMFLSKNWRDVLCRCEGCSDFYKHKSISFLLDKEDSIMEYEKMAKQKREQKLQQQEGAELSLLDNLGHVEKMEILNGIADMKDELHSFMVCPR